MKVPDIATLRALLKKRADELAEECIAADDAKWAAAERLNELDEARSRVMRMLDLPNGELLAMADEIAAAVNQSQLIDGIAESFK